MEKYLMGIDNGSQSTKVSIFDMFGNEVTYSSVPLRELHTPNPGVVEHPDDDLWTSVEQAIEKCLNQFTGNKNNIVAIGLCTIRCCRVLLKEDGSLASPVISWMDARLNKPYVHTDNNVKFVTSTSGYINFRLTGAKTDSAGNYEVHWPLNHKTLDWFEDEEQLQSFGVTRAMLFELVKPGEALGFLKEDLAEKFGLKKDLPIVASANDKAVDLLGSGVTSPSTAMISLGTFISAMVPQKTYFEDAQSFFPTLASIPYQYVYETNGIRRGMWTVSWFKKLIGEELTTKAATFNQSEEQYLNNQAALIPVGSEGLITILDWLSSPSTPYRKGMIIGFDQRHTKCHMYRSILEAIALNIFNNIEDMLLEINGHVEDVVINGGGSKSDTLAQIIADVFGKNVIRKKGNSSSGLGAAICAAVYTGIYSNFDEAISAMVHTDKVFIPNQSNHLIYKAINHQVVKQVRVHTDEILKQHYTLFN